MAAGVGRVLVVVTADQRRGAEVEGSQLAAALTGRGVAADAVALGPGDGSLAVEVLGDRPLAPGTLRALRRRARAAQVVVAYGSTTLPACAIALLGSGTPFVYRSIGDPARWVRGAWHRRRTALLFRRAARVVALWPAAAETIHQLYGVPAARIDCIPNARTEPDRHAEASVARRHFDLPDGAPVAAWVGALAKEKRPLAAIAAVAASEGTWLVMVGDGPLAAAVDAECERLLPGRYRRVGVVADLAPVWAVADVVVSTSATEGMPGVLVEAALHGVPAVATGVGAVGEVVLDGCTGRVVAAGAGNDVLAAAIEEAVARREEWGAAAAAHASANFTWDVVVSNWIDLLARVRAR